MLPTQTFGVQSGVNLPQLFQAALLSNVADAVISTDKNFTILTWNKAAEKIYGLPANLAIGVAAHEVFNYNYVNTTREEALATLLKEHQWKGIVKHLRNDKREILLEASVTEVISDTGDLIGYVAVNRDISEVSELRICMESLKCSFDQVNEGVAFIDNKGTIRYVNAKAHKMMRAISGEGFQLLENFAAHFPAERRAVIKMYLSLAFRGEVVSYETTYVKDAENKLYLDVRYCPLKNEYGEVNYVSVIVKNITKQKREQELIERLSKSRTLFEEFMNNSGLVAWMASKEGKMRYMNRIYLKTFRLTDKYLDKAIEELFPPDVAQQYLRNNEETLKQGQAFSTIEEAVMPNGQIKIFKVIKFPIYAKEETLIAGWAVDVTEDLNGLDYLKQSDKSK